MCYSTIISTNFTMGGGGGGLANSFMKKIEKNPDTRDIHVKTNSNSPNSKNSKSPFFNHKFQWVYRVFFGNFHIWYIARFGGSPLWLHQKIGNENTVNSRSLASSLFYTWYQ
jgi:hypothetical protein